MNLLKHAQPSKLYILPDKKGRFEQAMELFKEEAGPSAVSAVEWKQVDFIDLKAANSVAKSVAYLPRLDCI